LCLLQEDFSASGIGDSVPMDKTDFLYCKEVIEGIGLVCGEDEAEE
jgi:hypothetical protein